MEQRRRMSSAFVFYGQKAEETAGVCSTHRQPEQGEVLPNSQGLTNFKKLITIFFWGGGRRGVGNILKKVL